MSPAGCGRRRSCRPVAARAARVARTRERRLRDRLPHGELHRARGGAARTAASRRLGRGVRRSCSARRALRVVVGDEVHVSVDRRAADAGDRIARRSFACRRRPGADAAGCAGDGAEHGDEGPDDRLRSGGQREHRRVRSIRRDRRSPHAVGAWLHVDGAFGLWAAREQRRCAITCRASSAPIRGQPTRTNG